MGTTLGSIQLPDQPMDCCMSSTDPLVACGLVTGQIVMHRYGPSASDEQPAQQSAEQPSGQEAACSTSYSINEVFSRSSKKGASCRALCFCSGGHQLAAGFETGTLLQLDTATGQVMARLTKAHEGGINRVLGISDQPGLVAAGDDSGTICVWDLRNPSTPAYKYSKHTDYISCLCQHDVSSKQQQMLLAVSGDGTLSVHDLRSSKALAHSETDADDELLSVSVVKHGKKVVCGSQSGVLAIWSWGYWNDCSDRFPGHPESVDAMVKFDEDTLITGSSDGALRIVNILPNKLIGVVGEHAEDMPVERLALSGDQRVLASMSHDSSVKLWDLSMLHEEEGGSEQESEWEEASEGHEGISCAAEVAAAAAAAAAEQGSTQQAGSGPGSKQKQQKAPEEAAAATDSKAGGEGSGDGKGGKDDSDSDSYEEQQGGSKKRKRREKTAMTKGRSKPQQAGNFFADLL